MKELKNQYILSRILTGTPEGYVIEFTDEEMKWITPAWKEFVSFGEHLANSPVAVRKDVEEAISNQVASEALYGFAKKKEEDYEKSKDVQDLLQAIDLMGKSAALTIDSSRLYELGESLEKAERTEDARDMYAQFLEEYPEWAKGYEQSIEGKEPEVREMILANIENMAKIARNKMSYLS